MKVQLKKVGYTAPHMEATSFRTEQGYAGSGGGPSGTTQAFSDVPLTFQP